MRIINFYIVILINLCVCVLGSSCSMSFKKTCVFDILKKADRVIVYNGKVSGAGKNPVYFFNKKTDEYRSLLSLIDNAELRDEIFYKCSIKYILYVIYNKKCNAKITVYSSGILLVMYGDSLKLKSYYQPSKNIGFLIDNCLKKKLEY